ncbi:mechanosensitive ion channel domain-containing protein [Stenotrophomonas sp. VV52]|uniref:mechanosensitive ion channel family protein n=1 Tax=Stenotrophomonas sp. VV52 TaxID=2066958 RepID=UPI000C9E8E83|nr:mechanosensitive ion channel domain-containing protein [Stenotrophomonas sp. VV52]
MRYLHKLQDALAFEPLAMFGWHLSVGDALAGVTAVLVTLLIAGVCRRAINRYGRRHPDANQAALYTFSRLLHYAILVAGVLIALQVAGLPLSQFAVFTGAIGVGLGFGMQAIFSNFVSGLILLFDRSLKVGDFIELDKDTRGVVKSIDIRSTLITTNDNIDILVPNSEFVTKRLVNWTHGSVNRRVRIAFDVDIDVDKERVKKAALDAAAQVPFTLATSGPKRPQLWLAGAEGSVTNYVLAVWLTEAASRRNSAVRAAYLWELDSALKRHGVLNTLPRRQVVISTLSSPASDNLRHVDADPAREPEALTPEERQALSVNDAKEEAQRESKGGAPT